MNITVSCFEFIFALMQLPLTRMTNVLSSFSSSSSFFFPFFLFSTCTSSPSSRPSTLSIHGLYSAQNTTTNTIAFEIYENNVNKDSMYSPSPLVDENTSEVHWGWERCPKDTQSKIEPKSPKSSFYIFNVLLQIDLEIWFGRRPFQQVRQVKSFISLQSLYSSYHFHNILPKSISLKMKT